jgi:hypothetical protein
MEKIESEIMAVLEQLDPICKQADQYQINAGYPVATPAKEIVRHVLTTLTTKHQEELEKARQEERE